MWVTFRWSKETHTRNWKNEWWIGARRDFQMDGTIFGFGVWGFFLRSETVWRWKGNARRVFQVLARLPHRLSRSGRNRRSSNSDSGVG